MRFVKLTEVAGDSPKEPERHVWIAAALVTTVRALDDLDRYAAFGPGAPQAATSVRLGREEVIATETAEQVLELIESALRSDPLDALRGKR